MKRTAGFGRTALGLAFVLPPGLDSQRCPPDEAEAKRRSRDSRSPRPPRQDNDPQPCFVARRTRTALGHPRREWFWKNLIAQRADRLPEYVEWRNRRPRTALWRDRLARAAQADRPGQLVRAADDV